jgi:hypothetical protein
MPDAAAGPEGWSSRDKLAAVLETAALSEADLGEYCRKRGLYPAQIAAWRSACEQANDGDHASSVRLGRVTKEEKSGSRIWNVSLPAKTAHWPQLQHFWFSKKRLTRSGGGRRGRMISPPTSPNRQAADRRGHHRRCAAHQSLCRAGNQ